MFVDNNGSVLGVVRWQWKAILLYATAATAITVLDQFINVGGLEAATTPIAIVGGAIGIFVSFRTNSAYDRWWEGRKLWGKMINVSRHFASQSLHYVGTRGDTGKALARRLVERHIAYVHVLRCLLRVQPPLEDPDVLRYLDDEEKQALRGDSNMTHALLDRQLEALTAAVDREELDAFRLQSFDNSIRVILDVQGGCERIKKTPMPRGYGYFAELLIKLFSVLLPLGLVDLLGWFTIPISLLVCLSFTFISEVGRVLEDPFTLFWPALPLKALSKTIEANLQQRLGDADITEVPKPVNGILM